MKIALVSDTHVPTAIPELPSQLIERLHTVDLILHAGDLVELAVIESLRMIAETVAVHGNADEPGVVRELPGKQIVTVADARIGLIHGNQAPAIEREYLRPGHSYDSGPMDVFYRYVVGTCLRLR
jgi:putative phosphoesterase